MFESHNDIPAFLKTPLLVKKNSAQQKLVDRLASIPIPTHLHLHTYNTVCCADRVDDTWAVLRWFHKMNDCSYFETTRMYVNKQDVLSCRSDLKGSWVYSPAKIKSSTFHADEIILQTANVFDGTKLEYFKNISTELPDQSAALYMLATYPEFEKLSKAGLKWLCARYLNDNSQVSWKSYLESAVGSVDWKAKNIFKMLGINRHQIDSITEHRAKLIASGANGYWQFYYLDKLIYNMKQIFNVESLSSIDNATFDYILHSISNMDRLRGMYISSLQSVYEMYPNDAIYFIKDLNAVIDGGNMFTSYITEYGHTARAEVARVFFDTLRMIKYGHYTNVLRPRFSSLDELLNNHQIMVDLINADKTAHEARVNQQYNDGFKDNYERWKKWEWQDDAFCVIAPHQPVDIAVEGMTLHHCVKSYIPSIAEGKTNIVFIRRKGKESEPFFTVEVSMSNSIRQIHGMCNCNASSVEGLPEFVRQWAKLKKLRYVESSSNNVLAAR
jgi:hypothetical protein